MAHEGSGLEVQKVHPPREGPSDLGARRASRCSPPRLPLQPAVPASPRCHLVLLVRWLQCVCVLAGNHEVLFLRMPCPAVPLPGKKFFLEFLRRILFLFKLRFQLHLLCVQGAWAEGACTRAFCIHGGQRARCGSCFSPSTTRIWGIKSRWSGSVVRAFIHWAT